MKFPTLLLTLGFLAHSATAAPEDYRYRYEILGSELVRPMQMEMAPDGKIYVNELDGKLRLLNPETGRFQEVGQLDVFTQQESGFLGFALDPDFAKNGHIFIHHSPVEYEGVAITRFVIRDETLDLGSAVELLRWPVQRKECCHHAGALRFGPDGNLFISTGDNTSPFQSNGFTPIDEREGRSPFDAQKSSANTNDLRGKILRIKPTPEGGYTIPDGNLFPPGTAKTKPEIYAMGFRNPWRFNIDPKTGILYVGDVGPDSGKTDETRGPNGFDTINQIREPGYFGWPYSRGNEVYRDFDFAAEKSGETYDKSGPVNNSPNNTGLRELPPVTSPMVYYPHKQTEKFPEMGTGGRTACGGPVFHYDPKFADTDGFPEHFDGDLLFYDWQRPSMLWARLDEASNFQGLERFSESALIAQGDNETPERFQFKRPVDAFFGEEDGCLYVMDYGETWGVNADARIVKVSYQRGNLDPKPNIQLSATNGPAPLGVTLSAEGSTDPEGGMLSYAWQLLPEGKSLGSGPTLDTTIETPGNYQIQLTATDPEGASAAFSAELTVGNTTPVVTFIRPQEGDFFTPGKPIAYELRIEDAEDGSSEEKADTFAGVTLVTSEWFDGQDGKAEAAEGRTLMKQNNCFNCHAVETKLIGPALVDIAKKYKGDHAAMDAAAERVLKGSAGVWSEIPMLPHPHLTKDEIFKMVEWVFTLEKGGAGLGVLRGLTGELTAPTDAKMRSGLLEATFTDFGNAPANPLTGTASVRLQSRQIEAETAALHNAKIAGNNGASGKKIIGSMNNGSAAAFGPLDLSDVSGVTLRFANPGDGRKLEIRKGSRDGDLLGEMEVPNTGSWSEYQELQTTLELPDTRTEIHFVTNGAINIDWVRFNP